MDDPPPKTDHAIKASICVLASGSGGNCTVLLVESKGRRRACLLDAGISPRRTRLHLAELGLTFADLDSVLLTHLDTDHWHAGWRTGLPEHVRLRPHRRHAARARAWGVDRAAIAPMDEEFELLPGVYVRTALGNHDEHGVASLRLRFGDGGPTLGFATDIGRVTDELLEHLANVDVLAIESNYCPKLQLASARPGFLKARIMGGAGHLSNEEAFDAVRQARPRTHVVFLHLSRQCNRPELVEQLHRGEEYPFTITDQFRRTDWIPIVAGPERRPPAPTQHAAARPAAEQLQFGWAPALRTPGPAKLRFR